MVYFLHINLMADCIVEETEAKMNVYDAEYDNTKVANFEDGVMIFFIQQRDNAEQFVNDIFEKWNHEEIGHYVKFILWQEIIEQVEACRM